MTNTLPLDDVLISFDAATATIELRSKDPRLGKDSLRLSIASQSESYRALFKLLEAQGNLETISVPESALRIEDASELRLPSEGRGVQLEIGRGIDSAPVALDLSRNLLVAGAPGSGKSVLLRSILCYGLTDERVTLRAIDLKQVELSRYAYRSQDEVATTQEGALSMLRALQEELKGRQSVDLSIPHYSLDSRKAIYLIVDELAPLLELIPELTDEDRRRNARTRELTELIGTLSLFGREVGIYLFVGTQRGDAVPSRILTGLANRVLMGSSSSYHSRAVLRETPVYGAAYLTPRGRGILRADGGERILFQGSFIPYGLYARPAKPISEL